MERVGLLAARLRSRFLALVVLGSASLALVPRSAAAQTPDSAAALRSSSPGTAVIQGLAFDSTASRPLPDARVILVALDGVAVEQTTRSGPDGHFRFEDVAPGERRLVLTHPRLEKLGLTPLMRTGTVAPAGVAPMEVSIPSVTTLWPLYCRGDSPGDESDGVLFGRALDAVTGVVQPGVEVRAGWTGADGRPEEARTTTDGNGVYRFCGIPADAAVTVQAAFLGDVRAEEQVQPDGQQLRIVDLTGALGRPGAVQGVVTDAETGEPIVSAVVTLAGTDHRTLTGATGEFRFTDVPQDRYLLEMEHVAYGTQSREVLVGSRTVQVDARFSRNAIELEGFTVTVLQPRLEDEGYYARQRRFAATEFVFLTGDDLLARDSTSLPRALRNLRSLEVRWAGPNGVELQHIRRGARCSMPIFLDGMRVPAGGFNLGSLKPDEVEAIEIYQPQGPGGPFLPERFRLAAGVGEGCSTGGVVIWTR